MRNANGKTDIIQPTEYAGSWNHYKDNLMEVLKAPPVTWDAKVSRLSMSDRQELERSLSGLCERAARLIGYLEARGTVGCGDNGHASGVKQSNRSGAKVRKALGYTFPKQDIRF